LHPNSESSQHHRANEQERGERSQDIQFQGKVHVGLPKLLNGILAEAAGGSKRETRAGGKSASR
jgi:hypothetical protein